MVTTPTPTSTLLPLGRLELTYPEHTVVGDDTLVTVEIIANPQFLGPGPHEPFESKLILGVTVTETTSAGTVQNVRQVQEYEVELCPVMCVNLTAPLFEVTAGAPDRCQVIVPGQSTLWEWHLVAKKRGTAHASLNVSGQKAIGGERCGQQKILYFDIEVSDQPALRRVWESVLKEPIPLINGLLTLVLGVFTALLARSSKAVQKKVEDLEKKLGSLEESTKEQKDGKNTP